MKFSEALRNYVDLLEEPAEGENVVEDIARNWDEDMLEAVISRASDDLGLSSSVADAMRSAFVDKRRELHPSEREMSGDEWRDYFRGQDAGRLANRIANGYRGY